MYLVRRVLAMIPTLFGITIVSFVVMQFAPGDPLLSQFGGASATGQAREGYLVQKRDLKLDKPILLNFNYFRNYDPPVRSAAWFLGKTRPELLAALAELADPGDDAKLAERRKFLASLRSRNYRIPDLDRRLADPQLHDRLAETALGFIQIYCEDTGVYGIAAAMNILTDPEADLALRQGAIRAAAYMLGDPFVYTYTRAPKASETPMVVATWQTWWERSRDTFAPLSDARRAALQTKLAELVELPSRIELQERIELLDRADAPFFAEVLLSDESTLEERFIAATMLRLYIGKPLRYDIAPGASAEATQDVVDNWLLYYKARQGYFEPTTLGRLAAIVGDTQYAHMVWRLATFDFGRSTLRTREPVAERIWRAVKVSAPLMVMAQLVIYLVAVPLGIVCAVNRGRIVDRGISFSLFMLYSIPPFVAAMLMLLFLCYGDYLKLFPMARLHSDGAEELSLLPWLLDYLWHAFLPVVCLSLFSLAGLAMYSRTSMLEVLGQDFIRTARAKGVAERLVIWKHALRNALIPIITLFANFLPAMLGGSVLIEVLFNIPGMGRLSWVSIEQKDFPTLMAIIYIDAIVVMISILLSDLLYVLVDPRINFEGQGGSA